jgi:hypothetical protein
LAADGTLSWSVESLDLNESAANGQSIMTTLTEQHLRRVLVDDFSWEGLGGLYELLSLVDLICLACLAWSLSIVYLVDLKCRKPSRSNTVRWEE